MDWWDCVLRLSPTPESEPGVQRLLAESQARPQRDLARRELLNELAVGGAFMVAALALALAAGDQRGVDAAEAMLVFVGLVLGARVVFQVGSCYTMPIQLAFVPALFVLPPALAPLFVVGALLVARSIEVAQGRRHPSRLLNSFADSWFAIGPALVLAIAGSPAADEVSFAVLLGALAAQFAGDALSSRVREWLHQGASVREQIAEVSWIYLVDILLSPIGFALALAAIAQPAAVALCWPVFLLLGLFAHERDERLASLLELSEAYRGTARVLGEVVEHDDAYTGLHIRGVAELAVEVAADLGLDQKQRRLVEFGALLHDVGKIAIPKEIIQKPGPLDELEWQVIKTHTIEGQRMLSRIGGLMRDVGQIVRSSHERYDGHGYPDGIAGLEIPIESRIVFCCDAFNAMTTDRVYREALSTPAAIAELQIHAGTQFDPIVVEALLRRVDARRWTPSSPTGLAGAPAATPKGNGGGHLDEYPNQLTD
jgi:putative nucleotidyltransferase with HDIG domain